MDIHHLVEAAGILAGGLIFYAYVTDRLPRGRRWGRWRVALLGAGFGGLTVALMIARIQVAPGVFLDARLIPVALVGLFEGWPPALVAALLGAAYRASLGGGGMWAGIVALLLTAAGSGWVHARARRAERVGARHALAVAAVAILATLVGFALLGARGLALFGTIWLPYVLTVAVGIAAFARLLFDVTEQQRLRAVEQRFRRILDEASDGIRIVDADTGRVLEVNGAECLLTGLGREDLIGRPERDLWPADPALRAGHEALEARARQEERAHAHGLRHRAGDGQPVLVDATRRHVEYRGRRYAIVVSRDAAPRLAAEAAERERAELRSATLLARAAAHEINNPLAVIAGYLQLLQGRFEAESREGRWVGQMLQAAARIGDSVGRLNRLTRIESTPPSPGVSAMLDTRRSATPAPVVPAGEDTPAVPVPPPAP